MVRVAAAFGRPLISVGIELFKRVPQWVWPIGGVLMLLVSFYLLGQATENSAEFGRLYSWLLVLNVVGLIVLVVLVSYNLIALVRQYRARAPGSRLNLRLLLIFLLLAMAPVIVVFHYSVQFLNRGIDSWFDVRLDTALKDALALSQAALDQRMRKHLDDMRTAATEVRDVPDRLAALAITDLRVNSGAEVIKFAHPALQQYFAAASLIDNQEGLLIRFRSDMDAWRESVKIWCGLVDDASRVIETVTRLDPPTGIACKTEAQSSVDGLPPDLIDSLMG